MKRVLLGAAIVFATGAANAELPLFAAKCGAGLNVDTSTEGQVYVNGKVASLINRPDGQITARSGGAYIDITPQGGEPPRVTFTAKDKSTGVCEILSFKAPEYGADSGGHGHHRSSAAERAGQGDFDATGSVGCAEHDGQPLRQCRMGVARDGGGTAVVVVTRPDGRKRFIFFERGEPISADTSQADGYGEFSTARGGDLSLVFVGEERYEIPDAAVFGG